MIWSARDLMTVFVFMLTRIIRLQFSFCYILLLLWQGNVKFAEYVMAKWCNSWYSAHIIMDKDHVMTSVWSLHCPYAEGTLHKWRCRSAGVSPTVFTFLSPSPHSNPTSQLEETGKKKKYGKSGCRMQWIHSAAQSPSNGPSVRKTKVHL